MSDPLHVQVDGIFDYIYTKQINILQDFKIPVTNNILLEPVQLPGSVIYETTSQSMFYSEGGVWVPILNGGSTMTNIGTGVGIYKQQGPGNIPELRSVDSSDGTVTVTLGDTIDFTTSLPALQPIIATGDLLYSNTPLSYANLPIGVAGMVLTSDGTTPIWSPASFSNTNTVVVTMNPGVEQFPNIYSAMASIPTVGPLVPTVSNPYVIYVHAGKYQEPATIVFLEYVYIVGADIGGVIIEPLLPGYDLFVFAKATAISFLSIQGVTAPNYACVLANAGVTGYEFQLMHKVNIYDSTILCNSTTVDSFIYFEYMSFTNTASTNNMIINSTPGFSTYVSTENFFVSGPSAVSILVDGPNSYISGQACNMQGDGTGDCCVVTNGGNIDFRDTFLAYYGNGIHANNTGSAPVIELSGITFAGNTLNINIENSTASGYFNGFSEYNKTIINPAGTCTFFISNQNQQVVTVAPKGANFSDIASAIDAINPDIVIGINNLSTTITSAGLFTAALDTIELSATGVPAGAVCTFIDINTMTISIAATATATVIGTFLRASQISPYIVSISPGTYISPPVTVHSFISVIGLDRDTCIVASSLPASSIFNLFPNTSLQNVSITGVDPTVYAITTETPNYTVIKNIVFLNITLGVIYNIITGDFSASIYECIFVGTPGDIAINIYNPLGYNVILDINNVQCVQHYNNFFELSGPTTKVSLRNCALGGDGTGNVCNILDGCIVNVQGMYIINWASGFTTGDIIPNFPYLAVSGITFLNVSGNIINMTNPTTTGYYNGYIPYTKINVNPLNSFFVTGKDTHIITVSKKGGDFASVKAAVDSVVGATSTNIYIISVGPGVFVEDPIVLLSYIDIRGSGYLATTIFASTTGAPLITGADATLVENCALTGATSVGGSALYFAGTGTSTGSPFIVNNCVLANNATLVVMNSSANSALMILNGCLYGATFNADTGISVTSTGGQSTTLLLYNCVFQDIVNPVPQTLLFANGPGALIAVSNTLVQLNGTNTSVALRLQDGASARVYGSTFIGLLTGIICENIGAGSFLTVAGTTFEDCDTILAINNPGTTGSFSGNIDITKSFIHPSSPFYIRDRAENVLVVSKKGSDFNTISSAIAFINPTVAVTTVILSNLVTSAGLFNVSMNLAEVISVNIPGGSIFTFIDASNGTISNVATASGTQSAQFIEATMTTPYVVQVQPGMYTESSIVIPEHTSVIGVDSFSCVISPSNPAGVLFTVNKHANMSALTLSGATTGICILVDSSQLVGTDPLPTIKDIRITNSETGVYVTSTTSLCEVIVTDVIIEDALYGMRVDGLSANTVAIVTLHVNNYTCERATNGIILEGPNARGVLAGVIMDSDLIPGSSGIVTSDGAEVIMLSGEVHEASVGLNNLNVGAPCIITMSGLVCRDNTQDILIQHPGTNGCISMAIAERSKTTVNMSAPISITYVDPVINSTTMIGDIFIGDTHSKSTDVFEIIQHGFAMGIIEGGDISDGGLLSLSVASGFGYLTIGTPPTHYLQRTDFSAVSLPLAASSTLYIYVNSAGTVISNVVQPVSTAVILLGRVTTDATSIEIIEKTEINSAFISNQFDTFHRNAIGAVVATGLSVACSATRELTVGSGKYYFSGNEFNPSPSGPPAVYYQYNHTAGVFGYALGASSIENTDYDNLTGLVPIPAGEFVKHALYLTGDSVTQRIMLVIGQTTFTTSVDAVAGNSATPPLYFTQSVIPIADIVVQQGNATYSNVIDRRPVITSSLSSVAATLVHGNLLGLLNDDHPQYLLTNGSRTLTGPQDFGGNNITTVGTINGINLAAHASRHLPTGADPLTTAAPTTNLTATSTNAIGTANSFARSDHSHAVSTGVVSTILPNQVNATGVSANLARADHIHNIPSGSPVSIATSNGAGSAASFALSDHAHQGIHSLNVNAGTLRYGDITVQQGLGVTVADNGAGVFTIGAESGLNEFYPSIGAGLNVNYTGGKLNVSGVVINVSAGSVTVPAFSSGIVFVTQTGVVAYTLGSISRNSYPVASFVTSGIAVTTLVDIRTYINSSVYIGMGKTILVDQTLGDDTTGSRQGTPFASIAAGIAAALSGDIIIVSPGTYNETSLVLPTGVCMRGVCTLTCIISHTATVSEVLLTMGVNTAVADMTLSLSSSTTGIIQTGILFPGTTTSSAAVNNLRISVNSTTTGIANIYGIRSNSTGAPIAVANIINSSINVTSLTATSGIIRGIYNDNAGTFGASGTMIVSVSGSILDVAIESTNASSIINVYNCKVATSLGESSLQTAGTINLFNVIGTAGQIINSRVSGQLELGTGNTTTVSAPAPASDITLTLPITTDTLVGLATSDILLNKTIISNTNTVAANSLKTTGAVVSVSAAAPPTVGQLLTATSATTATWQTQAVQTSGNFIDSGTFIVDDITPTKRLGFQNAGATAGTTTTLSTFQTVDRVISFPDITDTVVTLTSSDVLTNKTLTLPVISSIVNVGTLTLPTVTDTLVGRTTGDILTNKTLTLPVISSIVNVGTLTLPTVTDTLVGRTTGDILTNKTLTLPVIASIVNVGTLTLPTVTDTLVARTTSDALTNKTLTSAKANQFLDTLGNVSLVLTATASAVNNLTITNSITTVSPTLAATGTDVNIDLNFQAKGTGVYKLNATATAAAEARLYEITGSGTNYVALRAGVLAANVTFTLPVTAGTVGQTMITDGTGVLSFSTPKVPKMTYCFATQQSVTGSAVFPATTVGIAYFGWLNADYSGFTSGKVTYRLQVVSVPSFDIRLYDATNNVVLGSDLAVSTPGTRSFSIINPTTDAVLVFQVRKTAGGGTNPVIMGIQWEWTI